MLEVCVRNITKFKEEWLMLPIENLEEAFENIVPRNDEYIIVDCSHNLGSIISQYQDIYKVNELLIELLNEKVDYKVFQFVSQYGFSSIENLIDVIEKEKYIIFDEIITEEELGEKVVEAQLLNINIPEELIDLGYIDFESIGRNYAINNSVRFINYEDEYCAIQILT